MEAWAHMSSERVKAESEEWREKWGERAEQPGGRWNLPYAVVWKVVLNPEVRQVIFPVVAPYVMKVRGVSCTAVGQGLTKDL